MVNPQELMFDRRFMKPIHRPRRPHRSVPIMGFARVNTQFNTQFGLLLDPTDAEM